MNSKVYKCCVVPLCKNTSIKTPDKLFVYVPRKKTVRDKWLKLARREPASLSTNSTIYFCEDHFDLPKDMENYMQYHVIGSVSKVRMRPGCMPKRFACQPDRKTQTSDTIERPCKQKKRKIGVQLVRPPSILSGGKVSKMEAKETKQIANLRIHIERAIRHLREFNMLKSHV